jgi:PIN domain nuclease of toxin-antitoxin system
MRNSYLLDTHALIWYLSGSSEISQSTREIIDNPLFPIHISLASIWEMAIKMKSGKLSIDFEFQEFQNILSKEKIRIISVKLEHISKLFELENHHRDPFDRMIIAQSIVENLPIITKDGNISKYSEVEVVW